MSLTVDRKKELQNLIATAQQDYSKYSAELKQLFSADRMEKLKAKYGEYKFKVYWYEVPQGDISPVLEEDYEKIVMSKYGLPVVHLPETKTQETYLLLKSEADLPRLTTLIKRIQAAESLVHGDPKNPRPVEAALELHKVILGEEDVS